MFCVGAIDAALAAEKRRSEVEAYLSKSLSSLSASSHDEVGLLKCVWVLVIEITSEIDALQMDGEVVVVVLSRGGVRTREGHRAGFGGVVITGTRLPNHSLSDCRNLLFWSLLSARETQDHYAKFVVRARRAKQQLLECEPITGANDGKQ